jgi:hypothetical protein
MMAKITATENVMEAGGAAAVQRKPVLMVSFGRGDAGKSTTSMLFAWRALDRGRDVLVADFDAQSKTVRSFFPDAVVPGSDELPDVKSEFAKLLNRVGKGQSAIVDFGGGDQFMREFGKDLEVVQFCAKRGIDPVAVFVLSPDAENLRHCVSVFESGHFRPERMVIVLNEGVIREGKTVRGAFEATMRDPGFQAMVKAGAKPLLLNRLPCMDLLKKAAAVDPRAMNFYAAAVAGDSGLDMGEDFDMVQEFMVQNWLDGIEDKLVKLGVVDWLP